MHGRPFASNSGRPTWPGGLTPFFPEFLVGPTTDHLDATEAIWQFLEDVMSV